MVFGRRPDRIALAAAPLVFVSLLALPATRGSLVSGAARLAGVDPPALAAGGVALLLAQASAASFSRFASVPPSTCSTRLR
jgi:hypothetical protein